MATPPRPEFAGAIHHIVNRGTRKVAMFHDDQDRRFFMRRLVTVCDRRQWRCLAYCLMDNHMHLVVETLAPTLGLGMRDLAARYAQVFNARHGFRGTTLEGRYRSRLVESDEYFAQLLRYVALNPVKAGLATAPEEWPWSSHAGLLGSALDWCVDASRVAELLEPWGGEPTARYARLFEAPGALAAKYADNDPGDFRPPLAELLAGPDVRAAIRRATAHGYRHREIADVLGVSRPTVSRHAAA